jgi:transposase InsO family protein
MPWLETNVRDQRIQFVLWAQRPGVTMTAACAAFGISRKTGYKWCARQQRAGSVIVLDDRSRRPQRSPTRTSATIAARVCAARRETGWGGEKLAVVLAQDGVVVAPRTIDRIIQRHGLTRADAAPAPALTRFERRGPNELWQMDAKGAYPLAAGGRCHPLSLIDDHSRYAVGLHALPTLETGRVRQALIWSFEHYGLPDAMLMDHGTPWWSTSGLGGLTQLGVFLIKQGIRVVFSAVRHPQTQGKVERFHRTLGERLRWSGVPHTLVGFHRRFAAFCEEYNDRRPHEALALRPPARVFMASPRAYQSHPRAWEYPAGLTVRQVDANGVVKLKGYNFFVSKALQHEAVGCEPLEDRILIRYRHMYVRELYLDTGHSANLIQPVDRHWPNNPADVLPMS